MRLRLIFLGLVLVFIIIIGSIFFYIFDKTVDAYEEFNRKIQEELYTFP